MVYTKYLCIERETEREKQGGKKRRKEGRINGIRRKLVGADYQLLT